MVVVLTQRSACIALKFWHFRLCGADVDLGNRTVHPNSCHRLAYPKAKYAKPPGS
jgi:hypothetical protein